MTAATKYDATLPPSRRGLSAVAFAFHLLLAIPWFFGVLSVGFSAISRRPPKGVRVVEWLPLVVVLSIASARSYEILFDASILGETASLVLLLVCGVSVLDVVFRTIFRQTFETTSDLTSWILIATAIAYFIGALLNFKTDDWNPSEWHALFSASSFAFMFAGVSSFRSVSIPLAISATMALPIIIIFEIVSPLGEGYAVRPGFVAELIASLTSTYAAYAASTAH